MKKFLDLNSSCEEKVTRNDIASFLKANGWSVDNNYLDFMEECSGFSLGPSFKFFNIDLITFVNYYGEIHSPYGSWYFNGYTFDSLESVVIGCEDYEEKKPLIDDFLRNFKKEFLYIGFGLGCKLYYKHGEGLGKGEIFVFLSGDIFLTFSEIFYSTGIKLIEMSNFIDEF